MRRSIRVVPSLTSPLEKLYYRGERYEDPEGQDEIVLDDWQYQVERFYGIGDMESEHYCDAVNRRYSYLN